MKYIVRHYWTLHINSLLKTKHSNHDKVNIIKKATNIKMRAMEQLDIVLKIQLLNHPNNRIFVDEYLQ